MYQCTGKIKGTSMAKFSKAKKPWMILECPRSIMNYMLHLSIKHGLHLTEPLAGLHISMVRGERVVDKRRWKALLGKQIEFRYAHRPRTNGKHWWLPIESEELYDIRESLGLKRLQRFPLHLTFGVVGEKQVIKELPKELKLRVNHLTRMKAAIHRDVWHLLPECSELDSYTERTET